MPVQGLYALQNGFLGAQRSLLFYGEFSEARTQIPITCYVVRTSDAIILFDTGVAPRAVPGLMRNDPFARFTDEDLLVHRLDGLDLSPSNVDLVVLSHLHYDHAGGAALFSESELVVQKDEYSYAHYPAPFFASFYYRKNFDLPASKWRLLDGDRSRPSSRCTNRSSSVNRANGSLRMRPGTARGATPVSNRMMASEARTA